jgi:hypothetical protein
VHIWVEIFPKIFWDETLSENFSAEMELSKIDPCSLACARLSGSCLGHVGGPSEAEGPAAATASLWWPSRCWLKFILTASMARSRSASLLDCLLGCRGFCELVSAANYGQKGNKLLTTTNNNNNHSLRSLASLAHFARGMIILKIYMYTTFSRLSMECPLLWISFSLKFSAVGL